MMISFFKDRIKFNQQIAKHDKWIKKFAKKKGYALNPDLMMHTNLEIWLSEMEEIYGKRYCPCFEPSGDATLDNKMLCPCKFLDQEIEIYGTCHCTLFGGADLDKNGWKASSQRLKGEYQIPLAITDGVLDTRGQPKDVLRGLPVPDAMHQLKNLFSNTPTTKVSMVLETKQELENLEKICSYRGYGYRVISETSPYMVEVSR